MRECSLPLSSQFRLASSLGLKSPSSPHCTGRRCLSPHVSAARSRHIPSPPLLSSPAKHRRRAHTEFFPLLHYMHSYIRVRTNERAVHTYTSWAPSLPPSEGVVVIEIVVRKVESVCDKWEEEDRPGGSDFERCFVKSRRKRRRRGRKQTLLEGKGKQHQSPKFNSTLPAQRWRRMESGRLTDVNAFSTVF